MISLDGGRFIATTIRMIIYILKNMFNGSWTTWNKVNRSAYGELWELFKAFFQWEVVPVVLVHKVSEASMRNIYPCLVSKARDDSIKMAQLAGVEFDGSDFSVLKPYNQKWIESSYWEDMIDRVWNKRGKL
nr:transposase, Ptta/En/Spm [Tanacetum cinerariifolium]